MTTITARILANVAEVETKELVQFWNAHNSTKPISKFADRKTAERRCLQLAQSLPEEAVKPQTTELKVHKTRASKAKVEDVQADDQKPEDEITEEEALAEIRAMREQAKEPKPTAKDVSAAIAASWADAEVAAARKTRHNVTVTVNGETTEHRSVRAAFSAFGLPDSKHIRFRMKLKAEGKLAFEQNGIVYEFVANEVVAGE